MWAIDLHDVGAGAAPAQLGITGASATRAAAAATMVFALRTAWDTWAQGNAGGSNQAGNWTANASAISAARIALPSDV